MDVLFLTKKTCVLLKNRFQFACHFFRIVVWGESTSILAPRLCRAALRWFGDHLGTHWGWRKQQGITASVPLRRERLDRWTSHTSWKGSFFLKAYLMFFISIYTYLIDICMCVRKYMNYYILSWIMCTCRAFADFVAVDMGRVPGLDVPRSQHGLPMGNPNIGPRLGYTQLSIEWTFSGNSI